MRFRQRKFSSAAVSPRRLIAGRDGDDGVEMSAPATSSSLPRIAESRFELSCDLRVENPGPSADWPPADAPELAVDEGAVEALPELVAAAFAAVALREPSSFLMSPDTETFTLT